MIQEFCDIPSATLLVKATAILGIAWISLRWKHKAINLLMHKNRHREHPVDRSKMDVVDKLLTVLIVFITAMLLMDVFGLNVTTLIAFGGIGGLAIAIASQEVIANFFSGLMIYLTHPFGVGDWVNIPDHNLEGHVEEIGWYMTRVRTFEKRPVYVPNSIFSKILVETPSRMSHRQFKEKIGLRYSDMQAVRPIIADCITMLETHEAVDKEQKVSVHLEAFGAYSVDILVSAYLTTVDSEEFALIKQDLLFKIIDILSAHSAEMASPLTVVDIPNGITLLHHKL